jgi:hypothetical protein
MFRARQDFVQPIGTSASFDQRSTGAHLVSCVGDSRVRDPSQWGATDSGKAGEVVSASGTPSGLGTKGLASPLSVGRTHSARPRTSAVTPSRSPYRTAALPWAPPPSDLTHSQLVTATTSRPTCERWSKVLVVGPTVARARQAPEPQGPQ